MSNEQLIYSLLITHHFSCSNFIPLPPPLSTTLCKCIINVDKLERKCYIIGQLTNTVVKSTKIVPGRQSYLTKIGGPGCWKNWIASIGVN